MKNVTTRISNPFGMSPPAHGRPVVFGYGDANADFHVIGDHPGRHGGVETGVPFTGSPAGERIQRVLYEAGLLDEPYSDRPHLENLFFSYLHMLAPAEGTDPSTDDYAVLERFFDAEMRAINAHVLIPVGDRAVRYVLEEHTSKRWPDDVTAETLHAVEVRGRGYKILPLSDPREWTDEDAERAVDALLEILSYDYRQTSDLGRFNNDGRPYWVR